jgi:hypothetical protein
MATGAVVTGARLRFELDGVPVGYATGVTVREMITYEPIKVMDNIQTAEHVPTDYEVSMTADFVRVVGESIKDKGWFAPQGATSEDHLTNILASGQLTASITDTKSNGGNGTVIMNVEGVRVSERNMNVVARGVVGTNVSMVAIRAKDEADFS